MRKTEKNLMLVNAIFLPSLSSRNFSHFESEYSAFCKIDRKGLSKELRSCLNRKISL